MIFFPNFITEIGNCLFGKNQSLLTDVDRVFVVSSLDITILFLQKIQA